MLLPLFLVLAILLFLYLFLSNWSIYVFGVDVSVSLGHPANKVLQSFSIPNSYQADEDVRLVDLDGNLPYMAFLEFDVENKDSVYSVKNYYLGQCADQGYVLPDSQELRSSPNVLCKKMVDGYWNRLVFDYRCGETGCRVFIQARSI
ncbi:MAG: hypothetical protein MI794_19100 [Pseudomonadales bacterium]|nr:hypothetical protein [Pseudomonadales bacterium]